MAHNKIWSSSLMTPAIDGQNAVLWREKPQEFGLLVVVPFLGTLPSQHGGRKRIVLLIKIQSSQMKIQLLVRIVL